MAKAGRRAADDQLRLSLACGATVENAARAAGVSEATAFRRLRDPAFRAELQQLRADMVQRTTAMLTASGGEAVKTLLDLQKATLSGAVRLGAARAILEIGLKLREATDLEVRLQSVEQALAEPTPPGTPHPTP